MVVSTMNGVSHAWLGALRQHLYTQYSNLTPPHSEHMPLLRKKVSYVQRGDRLPPTALFSVVNQTGR